MENSLQPILMFIYVSSRVQKEIRQVCLPIRSSADCFPPSLQVTLPRDRDLRQFLGSDALIQRSSSGEEIRTITNDPDGGSAGEAPVHRLSGHSLPPPPRLIALAPLSFSSELLHLPLVRILRFSSLSLPKHMLITAGGVFLVRFEFQMKL